MPEKRYPMTVVPTTAVVRSESAKRAGTTYEVTFGTCKCPDFLFRRQPGSNRSPFCKHLLRAHLEFGWDPRLWLDDIRDTLALMEAEGELPPLP